IQEMNQHGIDPEILTGFRTAQEEAALRRNPPPGGAAKGLSWHQAGRAVDFNHTSDPNFPTIVAIMKKHGFTWGGPFSTPDPGHFQYHARPGTNPTLNIVSSVGGD